MKHEIAQEILEKVKLDYDTIAEEFSATRQTPWDEFKLFKPYIFEGSTIADIGCGNGRLIPSLPHNGEYIGIDISQNLIEQARKTYPEKTFLVGSLLEIPIKANSMDTTLCVASLHHIPSKELREKAVDELQRITKPGGYCIITVWNLWQRKYLKFIVKALREKITFGDLEYNDLFIPWNNKVFRYYHAFTKNELAGLLKKRFKIIDVSVASKHNIIIICQKEE